MSLREYDLWKHRVFSKKAMQWGLGNADAVYHMSIENLDFLKYAKCQRKLLITDVFQSPITDELIMKEQSKFPFLIEANSNHEKLHRYKFFFKQIIELTDLLICPSNWVAQGVLQINPKVENKIRIVPYGSSINLKNIENEPNKGQFLFVGNKILIKGLPYLAQAATRLKKKYPDMDFRVAGLNKEGVLNHKLFQDLRFLGKLDKKSLIDEYRIADAIIVPSISEGLSGALTEAMNIGLPIIATNNAGIIITDEVTGLLIQPGNVDDICLAVEKLLTNRVLREQLSEASKNQAHYYSMESWEKRLVGTLQEMNA
jgi:glycosyltransferase involved in cell wall biosynthesis